LKRCIAEAATILLLALAVLASLRYFIAVQETAAEKGREIALYGSLLSIEKGEAIFFYTRNEDLCISSSISERAVIAVHSSSSSSDNSTAVFEAVIPSTSCLSLRSYLGSGMDVESADVLVLTESGSAFIWNSSLGAGGVRIS